MPNGYLQNAELALREAVNAPPSTNAFREHSRNIYHADIQLRQFAKPLARFLALGFLGLGGPHDSAHCPQCNRDANSLSAYLIESASGSEKTDAGEPSS
jgi:hypothetical protein